MNTVTLHRRMCRHPLLLAGIFLLVGGCRDLADAPATNQPPVANAGPDQEHAVQGQVTVTLDGSGSMDPDGTIVGYRWLSADAVEVDAGGIERGDVDPEDIATPEVTLGQGIWTFALWVEDDRGAFSAQDIVVVTVGTPVDPQVTACVEASAQAATETCRLCACDISDACREATTACDETCWNLLFCIDEMCAGVDESELSGCVGMRCNDFLSAGAAVASFGPCRDQCLEVCTAEAQTSNM